MVPSLLCVFVLVGKYKQSYCQLLQVTLFVLDSCRSSEWNYVSDEDRDRLTNASEDGEFW